MDVEVEILLPSKEVWESIFRMNHQSDVGSLARGSLARGPGGAVGPVGRAGGPGIASSSRVSRIVFDGETDEHFGGYCLRPASSRVIL